MMRALSVPRTGRCDLEFRGEHLASASARWDVDVWIDLDLYVVEDGYLLAWTARTIDCSAHYAATLPDIRAVRAELSSDARLHELAARIGDKAGLEYLEAI